MGELNNYVYFRNINKIFLKPKNLWVFGFRFGFESRPNPNLQPFFLWGVKRLTYKFKNNEVKIS